MVARWIARHAGLPLFRMPVDGTRHEADAGVRAIPPLPVVAMAASRCANPVIVVEMSMGNPPSLAVEAELAEMIDPRRNGRWIHDAMDVILDLSQIMDHRGAGTRGTTAGSSSQCGRRPLDRTGSSDVARPHPG